MGTTVDKLNAIVASKEAIRTAIVDKGVDCDTTVPLADYAGKIEQISGGGGFEWPTDESYQIWGRTTDLGVPIVRLCLMIDVAHTVDWGDGTVETKPALSSFNYYYHTYEKAGDFHITIKSLTGSMQLNMARGGSSEAGTIIAQASTPSSILSYGIAKRVYVKANGGLIMGNFSLSRVLSIDEIYIDISESESPLAQITGSALTSPGTRNIIIKTKGELPTTPNPPNLSDASYTLYVSDDFLATTWTGWTRDRRPLSEYKGL